MKDIIIQIQEKQTFNRNKLRFELSNVMEAALNSATMVEACMAGFKFKWSGIAFEQLNIK